MTEEGSMSQWIQDNLRIIISIGIVVLLVFAIYSYSKRNARVNVVVDDSQIEEVVSNDTVTNDDEINKIIAEINDEESSNAPAAQNDAANDRMAAQAEADRIAQEQREAQQRAEEEKRIAMEKQKAEESQQATTETQPARDVVQEIIDSTSTQKDGVVAVTAVRGDSATTLARKALAQYIAQNSTTGITNAHKIYIEDYLRKHHSVTRIHPGTEMQFTHAMIDEAIGKSRTLNDAQLAHLDTYARRVKNL